MPDYIKYNPLNNRIIQKWISVDPSVVENETNILQVTRDVIESITKYHIVDGGTVREMTQAEKDALDAEEAQAVIDAESARILDLDNKIELVNGTTLAKIDTRIDAIANLADAKTFLKRMCRYIIKYVANN